MHRVNKFISFKACSHLAHNLAQTENMNNLYPKCVHITLLSLYCCFVIIGFGRMKVISLLMAMVHFSVNTKKRPLLVCFVSVATILVLLKLGLMNCLAFI